MSCFTALERKKAGANGIRDRGDIVREELSIASIAVEIPGRRVSRIGEYLGRSDDAFEKWKGKEERSLSLSLSGHVITHQLPLCAGSEIGVRAETTHVEGSTPMTFEIANWIRNDIDPAPLGILGDLVGLARAFGLSLRACFEVVAYPAELAAGRVNNRGKRDGANPIGKPAETNIEAGRLTEARV